MPPTKKHSPVKDQHMRLRYGDQDIPRQSSRLAKMEPRIAARITVTFVFPPWTISTVNKMISTIDPKVVSSITPATFGNFRASS